jgi:hypothetical protein
MDMRKHRLAGRFQVAEAAKQVEAHGVADNSEAAVFGEIGLILVSTFGLVTLVQLALVAFHVA